jgi:hypothetical protein
MGRDKMIAEAEAELDLKEPVVPLLEDDPKYMEQKKLYCSTVGKNCGECVNKWCKNNAIYQGSGQRQTEQGGEKHGE